MFLILPYSLHDKKQIKILPTIYDYSEFINYFTGKLSVKQNSFHFPQCGAGLYAALVSINGGQPSFQSDGYRSVKPNEHYAPGKKLFRKPTHPRVKRCTLSLPLRRIPPLGEKRCDKDKRFCWK